MSSSKTVINYSPNVKGEYSYIVNRKDKSFLKIGENTEEVGREICDFMYSNGVWVEDPENPILLSRRGSSFSPPQKYENITGILRLFGKTDNNNHVERDDFDSHDNDVILTLPSTRKVLSEHHTECHTRHNADENHAEEKQEKKQRNMKQKKPVSNKKFQFAEEEKSQEDEEIAELNESIKKVSNNKRPKSSDSELESENDSSSGNESESSDEDEEEEEITSISTKKKPAIKTSRKSVPVSDGKSPISTRKQPKNSGNKKR